MARVRACVIHWVCLLVANGHRVELRREVFSHFVYHLEQPFLRKLLAGCLPVSLVVFTFAVESQLIGLAILALGIWLLVIGSNLSFLTGNSYASGAAVVVVIGVVTAIICLLGCVAGIALRKVLLVVVRQLKPLSRDSLFISFLSLPPPSHCSSYCSWYYCSSWRLQPLCWDLCSGLKWDDLFHVTYVV